MNEETKIQFYLDSKSTWEALFRACEEATQTIDFERYIFVLDEVGQRFINVFRRKAKEGVRVRILCDMVGSFGFYLSGVPRNLRSHGIEVRFFNPVSPWRINSIFSNFFRDHRKLTVVDERVGFVGGVGIDGKTQNWRDTEVRFENELATELGRSFEWMWDNTASLVVSSVPMRSRKTDFYMKEYELLTNAPRFGKRFIRRSLIAAIRNAKKYIYLTTPYFIPDLKFFRVLRLAARRGVDVRLLVPKSSDYPFIDSSTQSYFTLALQAGIKIYQYEGRLLHAKTAVIDDEWGTVGTMNLDNLSFYFNYEINVVSSNRDFIWNVKKHFFEDLKSASHVLTEEWIRRPLWHKIQEIITWPFHKFF